MGLPLGAQLGSHEIISLLGKGGMGEVYRAKDTRLKREVAIKILPEEFSNDADRVSRFQREAEVLASLNHPNIAAIYELQQVEGVRFLVLELVEGETLAERIQRGSLPIDQTIDIARRICEALEAAHEKGIVHRDLKPANVKTTPDGKVKVLDFGLAKAIESTASSATLSNSPTLSKATQAGVILGTAAYMSPEQAKGFPADARSDVFSFGCVLYEMLTGRQAFNGETAAEILASVLVREPDLSAITNARIRNLLHRCFEKNPKRRWQAVGDLRMELEAIAAAPADIHAMSATHAAKPVWKRIASLVITALIVGAVAAAATWKLKPEVVPVPVRFFVFPADKTFMFASGRPGAHAVISPDGRHLAYTAKDSNGRTQLWLRQLDAFTATPLPGTDEAAFPFWSPDSQFIGFFADEKLQKIAIAGGSPQVLSVITRAARGGSWNRDGVIIIGGSGGIQRVPLSGGVPVDVTKTNAGESDHRFPSFLPDGRHFLFASTSGPGLDRSGVYVGSLDSQETKLLFRSSGGSGATYAAPGYVLFGRDGTLFAQSFNTKTFTLSGEPIPIGDQLVGGSGGQFVGHVAYSASDNGILTYGIGSTRIRDLDLVWVDRHGVTVTKSESAIAVKGIALSPDGKRIAIHRDSNTGGDLWLMDWMRGTMSRFSFDAAQHSASATWSPDGAEIAFSARTRNGKFAILRKLSSGAGTETTILEDDQPVVPMSWSPDGRYILFAKNNARGNTKLDLEVLPTTGDRKPIPYLNSPFNETWAEISPDGKWVAYSSDESGKFQVFIQPFPAAGGKWQASTDGGGFPRWRADGKELFYFEGAPGGGRLMTVEVRANGNSIDLSTPKELMNSNYTDPGPDSSGPYTPYAVSSDGNRFLIPRAPGATEPTPDPVAVIVNWTNIIRQ